MMLFDSTALAGYWLMSIPDSTMKSDGLKLATSLISIKMMEESESKNFETNLILKQRDKIQKNSTNSRSWSQNIGLKIKFKSWKCSGKFWLLNSSKHYANSNCQWKNMKELKFMCACHKVNTITFKYTNDTSYKDKYLLGITNISF